MAVRLVLDANLSPLTRIFLTERFGFDAVDLITLGLGRYEDIEVVAFAKRENRVIVTLDLDFGEIFHRFQRGAIGVIILRIQDTTIESVNRALERFFAGGVDHINFHTSLVVIEEHRVRIRPMR